MIINLYFPGNFMYDVINIFNCNYQYNCGNWSLMFQCGSLPIVYLSVDLVTAYKYKYFHFCVINAKRVCKS